MPLILLGTIEAGANSVALFALDELTAARRRGEKVSFYTVAEIKSAGVLLRNGNRTYIVRAGDQVNGDAETPLTITTGIEHRGDTLRVTAALRDYITRDGLLPILNQACSEPAYDVYGTQIGYRLFEIDKGSAYDLAGIQDDDIVTAIDDTELTNPMTALRALSRAKSSDTFKFTYARGASRKTVTVEIR